LRNKIFLTEFRIDLIIYYHFYNVMNMYQAITSAPVAPPAPEASLNHAPKAPLTDEKRAHALEALRMEAMDMLKVHFVDNPLQLDPAKLNALSKAIEKVFPETGKCNLQPLRDYAMTSRSSATDWHACEYGRLADETCDFLHERLREMKEKFVSGYRLTPKSRDSEDMGSQNGVAKINGTHQAADKANKKPASDRISLKPGTTYEQDGVKIEVGSPLVVEDKVHLKIKVTLDSLALERHQQGNLPLKLEIDGIQAAAGLTAKAAKERLIKAASPTKTPSKAGGAVPTVDTPDSKVGATPAKPEQSLPAAPTVGRPQKASTPVPVSLPVQGQGSTPGISAKKPAGVEKAHDKPATVETGEELEVVTEGSHKSVIVAPFREGASKVGAAISSAQYRVASFLGLVPAPERESDKPLLLMDQESEKRRGRYRVAAALAALGIGTAAFLHSSSRQSGEASYDTGTSTLATREPVPETEKDGSKDSSALVASNEKAEADTISGGAGTVAVPLDPGSVFNHANLGTREEDTLAGLSVPERRTQAFTPWNMGDLDAVPEPGLDRPRTARINVPGHPIFNVNGLGTHSGSEHNQSILAQQNGRGEQRQARENLVLPASVQTKGTPEQASYGSQSAVMKPAALGNLDDEPLPELSEMPERQLAEKGRNPVFNPSGLGSSGNNFIEALDSSTSRADRIDNPQQVFEDLRRVSSGRSIPSTPPLSSPPPFDQFTFTMPGRRTP